MIWAQPSALSIGMVHFGQRFMFLKSLSELVESIRTCRSQSMSLVNLAPLLRAAAFAQLQTELDAATLRTACSLLFISRSVSSGQRLKHREQNRWAHSLQTTWTLEPLDSNWQTLWQDGTGQCTRFGSRRISIFSQIFKYFAYKWGVSDDPLFSFKPAVMVVPVVVMSGCSSLATSKSFTSAWVRCPCTRHRKSGHGMGSTLQFSMHCLIYLLKH